MLVFWLRVHRDPLFFWDLGSVYHPIFLKIMLVTVYEFFFWDF